MLIAASGGPSGRHGARLPVAQLPAVTKILETATAGRPDAAAWHRQAGGERHSPCPDRPASTPGAGGAGRQGGDGATHRPRRSECSTRARGSSSLSATRTTSSTERVGGRLPAKRRHSRLVTTTRQPATASGCVETADVLKQTSPDCLLHVRQVCCGAPRVAGDSGDHLAVPAVQFVPRLLVPPRRPGARPRRCPHWPTRSAGSPWCPFVLLDVLECIVNGRTGGRREDRTPNTEHASRRTERRTAGDQTAQQSIGRQTRNPADQARRHDRTARPSSIPGPGPRFPGDPAGLLERHRGTGSRRGAAQHEVGGEGGVGAPPGVGEQATPERVHTQRATSSEPTVRAVAPAGAGAAPCPSRARSSPLCSAGPDGAQRRPGPSPGWSVPWRRP